MVPPPGLQIYLPPPVTLTFDLLVVSYLRPVTACANLHQYRFIRFQNIALQVR